jgi:hypothetical protein
MEVKTGQEQKGEVRGLRGSIDDLEALLERKTLVIIDAHIASICECSTPREISEFKDDIFLVWTRERIAVLDKLKEYSSKLRIPYSVYEEFRKVIDHEIALMKRSTKIKTKRAQVFKEYIDKKRGLFPSGKKAVQTENLGAEFRELLRELGCLSTEAYEEASFADKDMIALGYYYALSSRDKEVAIISSDPHVGGLARRLWEGVLRKNFVGEIDLGVYGVRDYSEIFRTRF